MAETWFTPKEWKARLVEFAGRRLLRNVANGEQVTYDVSRSEGQVSQEGDAFNTKNMNDLEQRISNGFANAKTNLDLLNRDLGGLSFDQDADGNWGYKIGGADTVIPFKTEPLVYDFSDGTFNLSDSSKPYYVKDYKKLTKQNFHGSCSWSVYASFHHTDTADHEYRNSGGISFTYSSDTGVLTVKRNQTNGFITLVC